MLFIYVCVCVYFVGGLCRLEEDIRFLRYEVIGGCKYFIWVLGNIWRFFGKGVCIFKYYSFLREK